MVFIAAIASGSNGNCYYIGNDEEAILVDAGISCRETEKRMTRMGLAMSKVKAIIISHEHSDHIAGLPGISKKYQLPVYITNSTYTNSNIPVQEDLLRDFNAANDIEIGSLRIKPFIKSHDAIDPHSFFISCGNVQVGVFTDIGYCCKELEHYFSRCHAAFLETNYCEEMLENGRYPYPLKKRISGNKGHLSNSQAAEIFLKHRGPGLSELILSHLSGNNNTHDKVEKAFAPLAGDTRITVASRYRETPVFQVTAKLVNHPTVNVSIFRKPQQLKLF